MASTTTTPTPVSLDIVTVWTHHHGGYGGISGGDPVVSWVEAISHAGHAATTTNGEPIPHRVSGSGVAHVDSRFAEAGTSMAAYYENGESLSGPWWVDPWAARAMFGRDFAEANGLNR